MGSRRQARECALQALYMCDSLNDWSAECVDLYFKAFRPDQDQPTENRSSDKPESDNADSAAKFSFARFLVEGVVEHLASIDGTISMASRNWSLSRMARVDRNILRLGAFEINYCQDIPANVSINEAIEIAKRYGTDDSPMFINGVLDRVASDFKSIQSHLPEQMKKVMNS